MGFIGYPGVQDSHLLLGFESRNAVDRNSPNIGKASALAAERVRVRVVDDHPGLV
jgi:hypothetical protein